MVIEKIEVMPLDSFIVTYSNEIASAILIMVVVCIGADIYCRRKGNK